ncbi:hypothetical protein GQ457_07G036950 [Hibiscus cannabinus]
MHVRKIIREIRKVGRYLGNYGKFYREGKTPIVLLTKEENLRNKSVRSGKDLGFWGRQEQRQIRTKMDLNMDLNAPHSMGTTIIGVTYNGGVVLGADSRTSTGMYVANRASDKITQLTDNVYVCRSGSAADSQLVSDYVRYFLHQHTIQLGQPATVKVAANLIRLISYNNKNMLETGLIVGGWDKYEGGKIYGIPLGGTLIEQPFAIGGSGSSYLYGFFDQAWKEGMTKDEAEQLVVKAVSLAIARDGASGGVVRTVVINSEGVTRNFYPGDTLQLWHEELEPQNSLLDILNSPSPEPMNI